MSTRHFNGLTPGEAERLAFLAEECGELVHIICKILRHGYESTHPDEPYLRNRARLANEMGDVRAGMMIMFDAGDVTEEAVRWAAQEKLRSVKQWMHHQRADFPL